MNEYIEVEKIKELIKNGFDKELISFELDIPIEKIEQIVKEIDASKKKINEQNEKPISKMEQIRKRYKDLFFSSGSSDKKNFVTRKELSQDELEQVILSINTIQKIIREMEKLSNIEKRKKVNEIIEELKKIINYPLTLEQSEKLNSLMRLEIFDKLYLHSSDGIENALKYYRKKIAKRLAEAIDYELIYTDDIDKLEDLRKQLTLELEKENQVVIGSVRIRLNDKISKIKKKQISDKIKNDIPSDILKIVQDLVNGNLNLEEANIIIENRAKNNVNSKPKTRFSITEEQEKKQILIKIGIAIRDNANKFYIKNPKITLLQLQELHKEDINQPVKIIIENLLSVKRFDEAKEILDIFLSQDKKNRELPIARDLKSRIKNAEIADLVLRCINKRTTKEEDDQYFELIEKGIKTSNLKLNTINLGKNQDETKSITLKDIWVDNYRKNDQYR